MRQTDVIKENGEYYVVDLNNNIRYQLDKDRCLIMQINKIADMVTKKNGTRLRD